MLTRSLPRFGSRRSIHVFERNFMVYRSQWLMLVSGFFEPLFYLLSIGIGLNHLVGPLHVNGRLVSYATFVAPGMLATSAMNGAVIDSIFNTFFRLRISHAYDAILSTPLNVTDVALGEVWWALARAMVYAASFLVCMAILGDAATPWVILCWPAAILTSFAFSCAGLWATTFIRSWQHFDIVALVQLPLFLFSATFFPISLYPHWLGAIVSVSPLYQSAALLRGFDLGQFQWIMFLRAGYLVAIALVCLSLAARRFQRLLVP
ncbi:MAG TPA: ABC transporter permease [Acidimicrobiales bacterium]|jgi:lipooligosaccharide transport system permease protein